MALVTDPRVSLSGVVDAFLEYIRYNRNCAENTLVNYAVDLAQFADAMESQGITEPQGITTAVIRSFLRSLMGFGFAPASVSRKLSAIRMLGRYMVEQKILDQDPVARIRGPSQPERLPRALSKSAVVALIDAAWTLEPQVRNGTLLELMYACGLRVAEVASLRWKDLDLEERWLRVMGKGEKERMVPFGRTAQEALARWKAISQSLPEAPLFPGKRGGALTVRTIHRVVTAAAGLAGLPDVTPHVLRHSFATHMLEGGASLRVLQELLGHESLLTTQKYLKITPGHLRESYEAAHPRGGEGG